MGQVKSVWQDPRRNIPWREISTNARVFFSLLCSTESNLKLADSLLGRLPSLRLKTDLESVDALAKIHKQLKCIATLDPCPQIIDKYMQVAEVLSKTLEDGGQFPQAAGVYWQQELVLGKKISYIIKNPKKRKCAHYEDLGRTYDQIAFAARKRSRCFQAQGNLRGARHSLATEASIRELQQRAMLNAENLEGARWAKIHRIEAVKFELRLAEKENRIHPLAQAHLHLGKLMEEEGETRKAAQEYGLAGALYRKLILSRLREGRHDDAKVAVKLAHDCFACAERLYRQIGEIEKIDLMRRAMFSLSFVDTNAPVPEKHFRAEGTGARKT
jgi:hypothetical protein